MLEPLQLLKEGKTKRLYTTSDPDKAVIYFKDEAMAYNGLKRGRILGKGEVNNAICRTVYTMLAEHGIENHFIATLDPRQSIVRRCDMIPVAIKVRNRAAGSLIQRIGVPLGTVMDPPVVELNYCRPDLDDPLINVSHVVALKLASKEEMDAMIRTALRIDQLMTEYMREIQVELVDIRLEFGRYDGRIILADEISPDTARFWDARTRESLDIDRFRRDLGDAEQAYQELLHRMMGLEEK